MPRKLRLIDGPSIFSWASGTPYSAQVAIVIVRALAHSEVFDATRNENHLYPPLAQYPFKCLCKCAEYGWGRCKAKRKLTIDIHFSLPCHG